MIGWCALPQPLWSTCHSVRMTDCEMFKATPCATAPCTVCGTTLYRNWTDHGTDFYWADGNGALKGDTKPGPPGVHSAGDFLDWLLAQDRIAEYSSAKVRIELGSGVLPWQHFHRVGDVPSATAGRPVPECCDWPMQATRDGWLCRNYCNGRYGVIPYPSGDLEPQADPHPTL